MLKTVCLLFDTRDVPVGSGATGLVGHGREQVARRVHPERLCVREFNQAYRFGDRVVNEKNAADFLACLKDYGVAPDTLAMELTERYQRPDPGGT